MQSCRQTTTKNMNQNTQNLHIYAFISTLNLMSDKYKKKGPACRFGDAWRLTENTAKSYSSYFVLYFHWWFLDGEKWLKF